MLGGLSAINYWIGSAVASLNIVMVLITFAIVIFRYAFGMGWVWLQELALYSHAIIFMAGAGYALADDQHVKVDIFYAKASEKFKAWVRIIGTLIFLLPFCGAIFYYSWEFVANSWKIFEKSGDPNGLSAVFLLKTFILLYPVLLGIQGVVIIVQAIIILRSRNG